MKEAWRDPAEDEEGLEGQTTSRAMAGERGCLVWMPPGNPFPPYSPLPQVNPCSAESSGRHHRKGRSAPASYCQGPPYLGERFESQRCDNCPRGRTNIGCPQLAVKAGGDTDKPECPHPTYTPHTQRKGQHALQQHQYITNTGRLSAVCLWLCQVPIIPSHNSPPFKKLFKKLCYFGVP